MKKGRLSSVDSGFGRSLIGSIPFDRREAGSAFRPAFSPFRSPRHPPVPPQGRAAKGIEPFGQGAPYGTAAAQILFLQPHDCRSGDSDKRHPSVSPQAHHRNPATKPPARRTRYQQQTSG
jgi:hypothetical protein